MTIVEAHFLEGIELDESFNTSNHIHDYNDRPYCGAKGETHTCPTNAEWIIEPGERTCRACGELLCLDCCILADHVWETVFGRTA